MNNIYKNPTNAEQIKDEILNLKTIGEIKQFYVNMFPTFIICSIKKYSEDYPFLQNNWDKFCKENNVKPTEILIVDNFDFIQENSLVLLFCEIMSKVGFCVRKKMDIKLVKTINEIKDEELLFEIKTPSSSNFLNQKFFLI